MTHGIIYEYENNKLIVEFYGDYDHGNYRSYYLFAAVGNFAGEGGFTLKRSTISQHIKTIDSMLNTRSGKLRIDDLDSDTFLEFEFQDSLNPHLWVRGTMSHYTIFTSMSFEFIADQTILSELKKALK